MVRTVRLGGTASDVEVAVIGHGLMQMTFPQVPPPEEQCFQAIKGGVDAAGGNKVLLNAGEFYAHDLGTLNLEMLAHFYKKYPDYADKTVLNVKGGLGPGTLEPDTSLQNLRRSIDNINAKLEGTKSVDIYEPARIDPSMSIEEAMKNLTILLEEGKFRHIGLSECKAETLKRANAVYPIASVEIEVSPWSYEEETRRVIATAAELNIPILAYSPLGRGFLTGSIKTLDDIPKNDQRRTVERFKPQNLQHNLQLAETITAAAEAKRVSPAQLCLAWVCSLGPHMLPIPGSSAYTSTLENLAAGDMTLSADELAEINRIIEGFKVKGSRYPENTPFLWG